MIIYMVLNSYSKAEFFYLNICFDVKKTNFGRVVHEL